jgi:hypothetical protein
MKSSRVALSLSLALICAPAVAGAQITVVLPSTNLTSTLTATVSEQARVAVPAGVSFAVNDIGASTDASPVSVAVDRIVLATATKQVRVSLKASAATFTPSVVSAPSWSADDVSWAAGTWTRADGAAGTLSSSAYTEVATCSAGVADCSTSALVFTLAANPAITTSGSHTLTVTWKIESIGS